jgi:hypothetical protein
MRKTRLYCPFCLEITICNVIQDPEGIVKGGNFGRQDYDDIRFRQRLRYCNKCKVDFVTYEVHEELINELIQLRKDKYSEKK